MKNTNFLIIAILILGVIYRLILTSEGNFLFNMDNARDMVDVREMVILGKLRLTGPTSAIEGFYNGPAWYYLLAIPFIISGGDPYGAILMQFILWALGGFFLLKLVSKFGILAIILIGSIWIASNYVVLANIYTFNPNPVLLLTPLFVYLLKRYIEEEKIIFSIFAFLLAGLFFNFEMNAGVFMPPVIIASILFCKKSNLLKNKSFWLGAIVFIMALAPQLLFDLRHEFIMSKSVLKYLTDNPSQAQFNPIARIPIIFESFHSTFSATLMNQKVLTSAIFVLFAYYLVFFLKKKEYLKDTLSVICLALVLVPFAFYLILPVQVNPWHLGAEMAALVILITIIFAKISKASILGKLVSATLSLLIILYAFSNINSYFTHDRFQDNLDPSSFKNEIAAIDYVYKWAGGKNFKVYTYLPSVYDYPYQYLFWWYGKNKYGYIPGEYVYSPNKPQYIPSQDKFRGLRENFSGLVFLIKEPDRIKMRQAWENDFKDMEFISKEWVGPLEVEIRREVSGQ